MGEEEVRQVLYAVGDNHGNTRPHFFRYPLPMSLPSFSIVLLLRPHPLGLFPFFFPPPSSLLPSVLHSASSRPTHPSSRDQKLMLAYLRMNFEPVQRMKDMLHEHFKPNIVERDFSLAISTGRNGARLTHNHARQFQYGTRPLPSHLLLSFP